MPLPNQSLLDTKIQNTPADFSRLLRESGTVFYWEKGNFYLVTDYALAQQALTSSAFTADRSSFFISRMPNIELKLITDFFAVVGKMMVMSDGEDHLRRRRLAYAGMTDELLDRYKPVIEKTVGNLIARAAENGNFNFVTEIAQSIPSIVLADLFCIAEADRPNFYAWSNNMTQFFGGSSQYRNEDGIEVNHSAASIRQFFTELIQKRKKQPENDFLSRMLENQVVLGASDDEVVSQAIMMLVAGQVTTTDQICNNLYTLLTHQGVLETLQKCPNLVSTAIEEFNRLDPAVTFLFRVVKQETELGGKSLKVGDVIFISSHAVNRDPKLFERPEECWVARKRNPHMAYGFGPHFCLGAKLARLEMQACFKQLIEKYPNLSLAKGIEVRRKHHSLAFSGFEALFISLRCFATHLPKECDEKMPETTSLRY